MDIVKSDNPGQAAADSLANKLQQYQDKNILLLLSAGSWLPPLDLIGVDFLGSHITMGMLDDRFSTDPAINNYLQLKQTSFYKKAEQAGVNLINTDIKLDETLVQANQRWQANIQSWRSAHPDGVVIVTMGIGLDGHTAGLMPGVQEVNFNSSDWTMGYEFSTVINQYNKRLTVTNTFLRTEVDVAVVFASGIAKQIYVDDLQKETASLNLPFNIIREIPSVTIVTDVYIKK